MKLRKIALLINFILILFIPFLSNGQDKSLPGYYLNKQKDTIRGYFMVPSRNVNPEYFQFKKDMGDKEFIRLDSSNAEIIQIEGNARFESFYTKRSMDEVDLTKSTVVIDHEPQANTLFLKVLVKGSKVSLFKYKDWLKTRYYYLESGKNMPIELDFHYHRPSDGNNTFILDKGYQDQLLVLVGNNPGLEKRIEHAEYYDEDLINIVRGINSSLIQKNSNNSSPGEGIKNSNEGQKEMNPWEISAIEDRKDQIQYFIGLGANIGVFGNKNSSSVNADIATTVVFPELHFGFDLSLDREKQAFHLRPEISMKIGSLANDTSIGQNLDFYFGFKLLDFSISPKILFNFVNTKKTQVYVGTGIILNFSSYNNLYYYEGASNQGPNTLFGQNAKENTQSFTFNIPIELGLNLSRKLSFNLIYFGNNNSYFIYGGGNYKSFNCALNYFFGK